MGNQIITAEMVQGAMANFVGGTEFSYSTVLVSYDTWLKMTDPEEYCKYVFRSQVSAKIKRKQLRRRKQKNGRA